MKKSDLYRERARTMDMCEGTEVSPNLCCEYKGNRNKQPSNLSGDPNLYKFAVAILEGKPVFVGDKLYVHRDPYAVYANANCGASNERGHYPFQMCSWNPPKKTFMLNGVELPCPGGDKPKSKLTIHCVHDEIQNELAFFDFEKGFDAKKVFDEFSKILTENTK